MNNLQRLKQLEKVKEEITKKQYKEAKFALERELCKENLSYLVTEVLDPEYYKELLNDFHFDMMQFAENKSKRKLLLVPRGHFKSSLVTIPIVIQTLLKNPNARILITNATLDNAQDFLRSVKGYMEGNEKLKYLFGEFKSDKWNEGEIIIKQRNKLQIKEASVMASSVDKSIVSKHFDLIIGDDLVNRESINTKEQLVKTQIYYKDLLDLIQHEGKTQEAGTVVIIGTRWHYDDLYQHIMDKEDFDIFFRTCWNDKKEPIFPNAFSKKSLESLRKSKGSYEFCLPYEAPILMSNWDNKPIGDLQIGDEVIGWTKDRERKLEKSKVKGISVRQLQVNTLVMKSGRKVRCTKEHNWFTGRCDITHKEYRPAKVGHKLMYVCPTDEYQVDDYTRNLWFYLAGFFDADGSAKTGGCLNITQSPEANPESYKKIINTLEELNLEYSEYVRTHKQKNWTDSHLIWLKNNFITQLKLMRITNLGKRRQIADKMIDSGCRFVREKDEVVEIIQGQIEDTYSIETETGNYIAYGYASKNSAQYLNSPIDDEHATFKESWLNNFFEKLPEGTFNYYLTLDTAGGGEGKNADSNGWILNAVDINGNWYILECIADKANPTEIVDRLFSFHSRYPALVIGIERTMYSVAFRPQLEAEMRKRGIYLNIVELKAAGTNKEARIKSLVPRFERKTIFLKEEYEDLRTELLRFPKSRHDDLSDSLAYQMDLAEKPYGGALDQELKPIFCNNYS